MHNYHLLANNDYRTDGDTIRDNTTVKWIAYGSKTEKCPKETTTRKSSNEVAPAT